MEENSQLLCNPCIPESIGQRLLNAYHKRDLLDFKAAIRSVPDVENAVACLRLASADVDAVEYVKALLDANVDPNQMDKKHKNALILAAEANNLKVLEVLLNRRQNPQDVDLPPPNGDTILHSVVKKKVDPENQEKCVKLILQHKKGNFVNKKNKMGLTAVLLATKNYVENPKFLTVVKLFLEYPEIDLDSAKYLVPSSRSCFGTARDILARHDASLQLPPPINDKKVDEDALIRMLEDKKVEDFCATVKDGSFNLEYDNGNHTMLQLACSRGHLKAVQALLDKDANIYATLPNNINAPICLAAARGYSDILRLLVDKCEDKTRLFDNVDDTPLIALARHWESSNKDHEDCLQILLELVQSNDLDINAKNSSKNTALHYAAVVCDRQLILKLLKRGAYIGGLNNQHRLPITMISRDILEEHLDDCLEKSGQLNDDEHEITFDYSCLVPPAKPVNPALLSIKRVDPELGSKGKISNEEETTHETAPLLYMCHNPDLRPLLKHPIITSFLQLKWERLAWIFGFNLACFVFYVIFITIHILWGNGRNIPLLPVNSTNPVDGKSEEPIPQVWFSLVQVLAGVFWLYLVIRELFQFVVSPKRYFSYGNKENYFELALIATSAYMLLTNDHRSLSARFFGSTTILLCWGELILLVGRYPFLATYFEMLKRVSWNFFKFLAWYSILIIAFSLSFFALFRDNAGDNNLFASPITSVFKTMVMMTGEFDVSDIPFAEFPGFSHMVFVMFVFLIAIVLFNLLNGLAVSDTQAIKDDAELVGYVSRVKLVYYIERMVLGQSRHPCSCWMRCQWLVRRVTLFPESTSYVGRIKPNKNRVLSLSLTREDVEKPTQEPVQSGLANGIIRSAEDVMAKKSRPSDIEQLRNAVRVNEEKLTAMETNWKATEKMLKEILEKISKK